MAKQYGLIVPNRNKNPAGIKKPSIFNSESDSENEVAPKPTGLKANLKRQDRVLQQKAVEEDPTVYQYDELYDEMESKRKESKLSRKDLDRKPKYINKLLETAEKRKRENERRIEKQVQKEREQEGEEFKDKESFVTSSYRKKLEELKELEEQERREEYLETIGDVRKQGNLDGFYRHLYDQKVNYEDKIKKEKDDEDEGTSADKEATDKESTEEKIDKPSRKRKYRKRASSQSDSDDSSKNVEVKMEHLPSNLDADSDFSIDSSSDSEEDTEKDKTAKENTEKETDDTEFKKPELINEKDQNVEVKTEEKIEKKEDGKEEKNGEITEEPKPKKPKIDIWKKRTVGQVFIEACERYFERQRLREMTR